MPQSAEDVAKRHGHTLGPTSRDRSEASEARSAKAFSEAVAKAKAQRAKKNSWKRKK